MHLKKRVKETIHFLATFADVTEWHKTRDSFLGYSTTIQGAERGLYKICGYLVFLILVLVKKAFVKVNERVQFSAVASEAEHASSADGWIPGGSSELCRSLVRRDLCRTRR
jgi:hypothetical protein